MAIENSRIEDTIAEEAAAWYVTLRAQEINNTQREAFVAWLRTSPLHVTEYLAISGIGRDMPGAARRLQASLEDLRLGARSAADVVPLDAVVRLLPAVKRPRFRWIGLAAAMLVLFVSAAVWMRWGEGVEQEFVTLHGEQRTWQLPDLSVVRLNSDSAVKVRFDGAGREITLVRGQAYFSVARDPRRPFQVKTGTSVVTALGTVFDVYERSTATIVTVIEGRVAVQRENTHAGATDIPASKPPVELIAGDRMRIAASGDVTTVERADVPRATAWVRQEIAFERQPIGAVVEEFNRYNRLQLFVEDERVRDIPISGVFHSYDAPSFVDFLEQLPKVRVVTTDGRAVIAYEE